MASLTSVTTSVTTSQPVSPVKSFASEKGRAGYVVTLTSASASAWVNYPLSLSGKAQGKTFTALEIFLLSLLEDLPAFTSHSWRLRIIMRNLLRHQVVVVPFLREMIAMVACMMIVRDLARLVSISPHVKDV